jgi:hypothetical protein
MDNIGSGKSRLLLSAALAVTMLVTRSNYFDWVTILPSASLAIFFLVGFYLRSYLFFITFSVLAYGCDYWVLTVGGEGCFTSAYGFIFAGYFLVWRMAKWAGENCDLTRLADAGKIFAAAVLSISGAFLISNGSFYAFSGNFTDLSLADYSLRVMRYYLSYLTDPLMYLVAAAMIHRALQRWQAANAEVSE